MTLRTLLAAALAGAFAVPLAAQASADGDTMIVAQSPTVPGGGLRQPVDKPHYMGRDQSATGGTSGAGATSGASAGASSPASGFAALDTNNDGMISRAEWDQHAARGQRSEQGASSGPRLGYGDAAQSPHSDRPVSGQLPSSDGSR